MREPRRWYEDACGTALALEFLGERRALLVIRELMLGPRRFSGLRADLPGISANVLTQRLEGLERSGIVARRQLPPPSAARVYELSTEWERAGMVPPGERAGRRQSGGRNSPAVAGDGAMDGGRCAGDHQEDATQPRLNARPARFLNTV